MRSNFDLIQRRWADHSLSADPLTSENIRGYSYRISIRGTGKKLPVEEMSQIEGIEEALWQNKIEKGAKINASLPWPQTGIRRM